MKRKLMRLSQALPESGPPTEFRLFAFGENETSKGTFILDALSAAVAMAAYRDQGNDLYVDYDHSVVHGGESIAAGWFGLEQREDGIWAVNVRWTDKALAHLEGKEYRYFSPYFMVDENNRIVEILNIALTNFPATKRMQPLIAADRRTVSLAMSFDDIWKALRAAVQAYSGTSWAWVMEVFDEYVVFELEDSQTLYRIPYQIQNDQVVLVGDAVEVRKTYEPIEGGKTMKTVLTKLGLQEEATEAQALSAVTALQEDHAQLIALTGKPTAAEALAVVRAWQQGAEQVPVLSARVDELEQEKKTAELNALIQQGQEEGKLSPAMLEWAKTQSKESLTAFLSAAPKLVVTEQKVPPQEPGSITLSQAVEEVKTELGKAGKDVNTYRQADLVVLARKKYPHLKGEK
jgi:phage I-like protein